MWRESPTSLLSGVQGMEITLTGGGFAGLADVLEKLATLPGPEEVLALRPSASLQTRIDDLLERNQAGGLSAEEQREWEQYRYVEHLVRMAKARAALALEGK